MVLWTMILALGAAGDVPPGFITLSAAQQREIGLCVEHDFGIIEFQRKPFVLLEHRRKTVQGLLKSGQPLTGRDLLMLLDCYRWASDWSGNGGSPVLSAEQQKILFRNAAWLLERLSRSWSGAELNDAQVLRCREDLARLEGDVSADRRLTFEKEQSLLQILFRCLAETDWELPAKLAAGLPQPAPPEVRPVKKAPAATISVKLEFQFQVTP